MQDSLAFGVCKGGLVVACKLYKLVAIVKLRRPTKLKDLVG